MSWLATYKYSNLAQCHNGDVISTVELGGVTPENRTASGWSQSFRFRQVLFLAQRLTPDLSGSPPLVPAYRGACAIRSGVNTV
jgi:hypothetical protein